MNRSTPSIETILAQAVEIATPVERQAFVEQACGGDGLLQRRVEQLIANHFQAGSFLERPAVALDPDGTAGWQAAQSTNGVGTVIGPYKLLEQLGEGGMGLVFVAEQQQPVKRRVALKVIKPGMDSRQVIARFEAERQALALMDHPNIAKVHDGGATPEGRPYFVMELVNGTPITDYCDQQRLTMRQRLELFLDVCHAVQHAHQKGIIHRDIKPSNILVEVHDVHPVVKVIDFGIAKATGQQLTDKTVYTGVAQLVGTPLYMSPEQAGLSSLDVDTRSDVYSLGVLLYELLTGMTPFDKETFKEASYDEMRRIIREDEPPRPSTRFSTIEQAELSTIAERRGLEPRRMSQHLRGELDWIVMKALEKDRNRRYESASAFAADVQRYLNDEPVMACPPSKLYQLRKFTRRHKAGLAVASLLLLVVLLGGSGGVWWLRKQATATGEARVAVDDAGKLLEQQRWFEALAAARRAEGVLASVGGNAELRRQVQILSKDSVMALDLQEAEARMTFVKDGHFDAEAGDAAYARAFSAYGLDVDRLEPHVAAEQIAERPIHGRLVAALDDWAITRLRLGKDGWRQRLAVTRIADADDERNRIRDQLEGKDPKAVEEIAAAERTEEWPLPTLILLGKLAYKTSSAQRVALLLERGQQRHPADFWLNQSLLSLLQCCRPRHPEEELRHASIAVALQPQSPGAHLNLGHALHDKGRLEAAIVAYREALHLNEHYAEAHANLGVALWQKGLLDESIAAYHKAIHLNKEDAGFHFNLGLVLVDKGQLDEAIAAYRAALQLNKDSAEAHLCLGVALKKKRLLDEAMVEYREAIRLKKDNAEAHNNLGNALYEKGRQDEAIDAYHKAIQLKQADPSAHFNLGNALAAKGRLEEAIAEYREAIRHQKDHAGAHFFLGYTLLQTGPLQQAVEELRLGHQLGSRDPRWPYPSAPWVQKAERLLALDHKLSAVLEGKEKPADVAERLAFAQLCQLQRKQHAAAVRFYREAFDLQKNLTDDRQALHRYNAACSAALAGCGEGKDSPSEDAERARLRRRALEWLRAELKIEGELLKSSASGQAEAARKRLEHWLDDSDLSGVRGEKALSKLPEAERQAWQQLWMDVADTLAKSQGKATAKKKPDTK